MTLTKPQRFALQSACNTVECYLRLLGPDVQVTIQPTLVEVGDVSWSGSSVDKTLFKALKDALTVVDQ